MEAKVVQEFKGIINEVEFTNENVYYSTEFLLEKIEENFGEVYKKEFIEDLKDTIEIMRMKYEEFSYDTLESEFSSCIEKASSFNDINFDYYGSDWKIENLNENIENGIYIKDLNEKEKVLKSLDNDYKVILDFDLKYRDDIEIMQKAVECELKQGMRNGDISIATLASENLKGNRNFVEFCVSKEGALIDIFPKFQNDRDIVLKAVETNGMALQFASESLKNDVEVVLKAVKNNEDAFEFVGSIAQMDKRLSEVKSNFLWRVKEDIWDKEYSKEEKSSNPFKARLKNEKKERGLGR